MEQEWQQVSRRRGRSHARSGARRASEAVANGEEEVEPVPEVSAEKQTQIIRRVRTIANVIRDSKPLKVALSAVTKHFELNTVTVKTPVDVESSRFNTEEGTESRLTLVGYGIGSFCASSNAVHQLGFMVALREALSEGKTDNVEVADEIEAEIFDPAMNKSDAAIAEHFQLEVIQENEHGRRRVASNTVFFMPHCGKTLYENVLACNWGPAIKKIIIIGNSFSAYGDRVLASKERLKLVLVGVLPYLEEVALSCGVPKTHEDFGRYEAAFNDLSVHLFPSELLRRGLQDASLNEKMNVVSSLTLPVK
ncbi:hypothetical protein DVH05_004091 [Phytophthora capsici]|nr:hypothetical protein DVH05_004091 [Phytophthora capsici]|eukprot:jgi/Phyca11/6081/fgenesh1_pm.PHYCAscaffold_9_\